MPGPRSPDVWIADLRVSGQRLVEIAHERQLLTDDEIARATAIADASERVRWTAAHAALHLVLEDRVGWLVRFAPASGRATGKLRAVGWEGDFSLAHSGDLVLIATVGSGQVGIDVEVRRDTRLDDRRRRLIVAAGEAVLTGPSPVHADTETRLLAAWTRLEAIAKARGDGIGAVLEALGLHAAEADETSASMAARRLLAKAGHTWAVHDIDVARYEALAALAQPADAGSPTIRYLADELVRLTG